MGKHVVRMLRFAIDYPNVWHPYGSERGTLDAIKLLSLHGFVEVDRATRQFRLMPSKAKREEAK